jgi:hypothetical protein
VNRLSARCAAFTLAALLFIPPSSIGWQSTALSAVPSGAPRQVLAVVTGLTKPARIAVPQPSPRAKMPLPPFASLHATISHDIHTPHGVRVQPPPMLRARGSRSRSVPVL